MPEIWLPYGAVEVPLKIKVENLGKIHIPNTKPLNENSVKSRIKELELAGNTLILVSEADEASASLIKALVNAGCESSRPSSITVCAERSLYSWVKKVFEGLNVSIKVLSAGEASEAEVQQYDTKLLVSKVSFNPLFGFSGGPVTLLKTLRPNFVAEAFERVQSSEPRPGEETEASFYAYSEAERLRMLGLEYISINDVLVEIAVGDLVKAHKQISQTLLDLCKIDLDNAPEAIIASAGSRRPASTLASALDTLWNVTKPLENSIVVFFAECIGGLGSEAIRLTATRNIEPYLTQGNYIDGLESIIYLKWLIKKAKLALLSTLPRYYVTRLGFDYLRSASEALPYILKQKGSKVKIHIFPLAEATLLAGANQT
jgi:nickel-dependent lactate racemase